MILKSIFKWLPVTKNNTEGQKFDPFVFILVFILILLGTYFMFRTFSFWRPPHSRSVTTSPYGSFSRPVVTPKYVTEKGEWSSIGEHYMNLCMENIFKHKFTKIRPTWLVNPKTGRCLELDMYNEELKIAGEYNGAQHYKFTPKFHKSEEEFKKQQERDKVKALICKKMGIKLIVVPYTISQKNMQDFIYNEWSQI